MSLSSNFSYCVSIVQVCCLGSVCAEGRDCMRERLVCMECVVKSGKTSQLIIMYHNRSNHTHKLVVAHNITILSIMLCAIFTKAWLTTTTTTDLLV